MSDTIYRQETQFGLRTPDGREHFASTYEPLGLDLRINYFTLDTEKGQEDARRAYRFALQRAGLPEDSAEIEFIQRVESVTHSPSIPLVPKPQEPEVVNEEAPHPLGEPVRLKQNRV